ncbi:hypothetical protein DRH14_05270, partial [Candidatus Shapirobacteria bacterium]
FFILTLLIYSFFNSKNQPFLSRLGQHFLLFSGFFLALACVSPLLFFQLKQSQISLTLVKNWSMVLGKLNLKNLLLIPLKFSFGRISFYPKNVYYLLASSWTIFLLFNLIKGDFSQIKVRKLLVFLLTPLFLASLLSLKLPMIQYFRFLYLLPIFMLALDYSISKTQPKLIIAIGFLLLSLIYSFNSNFHREDWKGSSESLGSQITIYMIPSFADPLHYYRPDVQIKDIRLLEQTENLPQQIILTSYGFPIFAFDHQTFLKKLGYHLLQTTSFRQIDLEKWVKN